MQNEARTYSFPLKKQPFPPLIVGRVLENFQGLEKGLYFAVRFRQHAQP